MPQIISFAPENVTGVEVSGFWRLLLGAAPMPGGGVGIGLMFFKYMGPGSTPVALARLPVNFVKAHDPSVAQQSINRVADKCICMGSLEGDRERSAEAWQMFKNSGASEKEVQAVIENVNELINAYWQLRRWVEDGFPGQIECLVPAAQTRLVASGDGAAEPKEAAQRRAERRAAAEAKLGPLPGMPEAADEDA